MKKQKFLTILLISGLVIGGALLFFSQAKALELHWPPAPGGKTLDDTSTLVDFVDYAYRWGVLLGGLAAFIALIIAGFQYLTSVGDPNKIKDARDRIISALIGLALLFGSYIIISILNPDLLRLSLPTTNIGNLGAGQWSKQDWSKPCEFVKIFKNKNFQASNPSEFAIITPTEKCITPSCSVCLCLAGAPPGTCGYLLVPPGGTIICCGSPCPGFCFTTGTVGPKVGSIQMKGSCQINLYSGNNCDGDFIAVTQNMANTEWTEITNSVGSLKVMDISPPTAPDIKTVSASPPVLQPDGTYSVILKGQILDFHKADKVTVHFEYGTNDISLDKTAPKDGSDFLEIYKGEDPSPTTYFFTSTADGLASSTTYFWRAVGVSIGGISFGATSSFTTP
ncbi:fibronectin type III domain-containing protein [bacterium]|nr:fibronectin type III domain-containing protein [bacterium]